MSKNRYINTKFWDDTFIVNLDPIEKLLYLYFLTNPLTNVSGIYELPLKRIAFDTGVDRDTVMRLIERFTREEKIYYIDGWIIVKNFVKNQSINPNMKIGIERELKSLPEKILLFIGKSESLVKALEPFGILNLTILNSTLLNSDVLSGDADADAPPCPDDVEEKVHEMTPSEETRLFFSNSEIQEKVVTYLVEMKFEEEFARSEIKNFIGYWREKNPSGKKERWEMERTFEVKRRLSTWMSKAISFNGKGRQKKQGFSIGSVSN